MNLVPLGISENTEDDAGSAESGGQADEGAKDKSAGHKKKGENQDCFARPTTGRNGPIRAGFSVEVEVMPIVEKTSAKVETGKGKS